MKKVFRLLVTLLLLGGWTLSAAALHVIRTPDEQGYLLIIPKNRLGFSQTYVDIRNWTATDVAANETLVARMTEAGKGEKLAEIVAYNVGKAAQQKIEKTVEEAIDESTRPTDNRTPAPRLLDESRLRNPLRDGAKGENADDAEPTTRQRSILFPE